MNITPKKHDHKPEITAKVAVERTRKSKEPLDHLTRDVLAAQAAGMSYGQYKALHPHTGEDGDDLPPQPDPGRYVHTCVNCGKEIVTRNIRQRRFCGDECRLDYYYKKKRQEDENRAQQQKQAAETPG